MELTHAEVDVFDHRPQPVARIALNGYNIDAGAILGRGGQLRSFRVIHGDVSAAWRKQTILAIHHADGAHTKLRIFALPSDAGEFGLVEFV